MCNNIVTAFICQREPHEVKTVASRADLQHGVPIPAILLHRDCTHCSGREGNRAIQGRFTGQCHSDTAQGPELKIVLQQVQMYVRTYVCTYVGYTNIQVYIEQVVLWAMCIVV